MELFYNNNNKYSAASTNNPGSCKPPVGTFAVATNDGPATLVNSIVEYASSSLCGASTDSWAFSVVLPGCGKWCVD